MTFRVAVPKGYRGVEVSFTRYRPAAALSDVRPRGLHVILDLAFGLRPDVKEGRRNHLGCRATGPGNEGMHEHRGSR